MNRTDPDQLIKGNWYAVNGSTVRFLGEMFNGPNPRQWRFKGEGPNSYKTLTEREAWGATIFPAVLHPATMQPL